MDLFSKFIIKNTNLHKYSQPLLNILLKIKIELFPIIILECLRFAMSPPVVNKQVHWTCFEKAPTCLYRVPQLTVQVRGQISSIVYRTQTLLSRGRNLGKDTKTFLPI